MNTILTSARRALLLCAGAALMIPGVRAADQADALKDAFTQPDSYIKISGQAASITGDGAAYAATHVDQSPSTGVVGIEDFRYAKDLSDVNSLLIKGHSMEGSHDYLANVTLTNNNYGSLDVGYSRYRIYYDAVGGFFPQTDLFEKSAPEAVYVNKAAFWAIAKLAKENCPVFTLSFRDEVRTGMKDSTDWAAVINPLSTVTAGALVGTALPANTPFIAPNVMTLDEHHVIVEGSMVGTFGKVSDTFRATVETVNNDDSRAYVRYGPTSNVIADPTVLVNDDSELTRRTSFRALNEAEVKFSEKISLDVGLTYLHSTQAMGGNWLTPTYSSTANTVYVANTAAAIYGSARVDNYIGNLTLKLKPVKDLDVDLAYRAEDFVVGSQGGFLNTTLATGAKVVAGNITANNELTYSHYSDHVNTPEVSVEYTGIEKVTLYGSISAMQNRGNQHWINPYAAITTTGAGVVTTAGAKVSSIFFQSADQDYEDAKVGVNWNATNQVTLRLEGFRKDHENKFIGASDIIGTASFGSLYVTGYNLDGFKGSLILKPFNELSFSTRYRAQDGNMSVMGNAATNGNSTEVTSGRLRSQQICETVDYTPVKQVYLEGSVAVNYNYIQTAYPVVVVSSTTNIATPIQNANNNYVSSSALAGFVLEKNTDLQLQGVWTTANNYNPQIALGGQPYGASFRDLSLTAGLKHKFTDSVYGECKFGYLRRSDNTTGGFTNYHGPLAYASITCAL
jgi:hypothetical protein